MPPNLRTLRARRNPVGIVAGMAISLPLAALLLLAHVLTAAARRVRCPRLWW